MISLDYKLNVPDFPFDEIGSGTMVRAYDAELQLTMTNDGPVLLRDLSIRAVLELYVGQEKAQLFHRKDTQIVKELPSRGAVSLDFGFQPIFPGLVSIAFYVTDAANSAVMAKRKTDPNYAQAPVRWWFYVIDDISVETCRLLTQLVSLAAKKKRK